MARQAATRALFRTLQLGRRQLLDGHQAQEEISHCSIPVRSHQLRFMRVGLWLACRPRGQIIHHPFIFLTTSIKYKNFYRPKCGDESIYLKLPSHLLISPPIHFF